MKWIKAIITFLGVIFSGMAGGQGKIGGKGLRRFCIPSLAVLMNWKRGWPLVFLMPILIMGYGEHSWLMQHIGNETLVRAVYAFLLSLPFAFYGLKRALYATIMLVVAFQVRAGSLGYWDAFGDFLVEDMVRYGTVGILIAFNLFFYDRTTE